MMEPDVESEYARARSFHDSPGEIVETPLAPDAPRADGSTRFARRVYQSVQGKQLDRRQARRRAGRPARDRAIHHGRHPGRGHGRAPHGVHLLPVRHTGTALPGPVEAVQPQCGDRSAGRGPWSISQPTLLEALRGESIWVVISKDYNASKMSATVTIFGDLADA